MLPAVYTIIHYTLYRTGVYVLSAVLLYTIHCTGLECMYSLLYFINYKLYRTGVSILPAVLLYTTYYYYILYTIHCIGLECMYSLLYFISYTLYRTGVSILPAVLLYTKHCTGLKRIYFLLYYYTLQTVQDWSVYTPYCTIIHYTLYRTGVYILPAVLLYTKHCIGLEYIYSLCNIIH